MSDLDIGVLYDGNVPVMEELKQAAEKIDLINLNKTPVHLQHEILYRGEQIFNRVPERTADFVENVLEIYMTTRAS